MEHIKEFNIAGDVQQWIEALVFVETIEKHEQKLRTEYKQIFEPILHMDELPWDVVAEIQKRKTQKKQLRHIYILLLGNTKMHGRS